MNRQAVLAAVLILGMAAALGVCQSIEKCGKLEAPRFGSLSCTAVGAKCVATCPPWASMSGEATMFCDTSTGAWSSEVPVCHPNNSDCEEPSKCPSRQQRDLVAVREALSLTKEEEDEIARDELDALKRKIRSVSRPRSCYFRMCLGSCDRYQEHIRVKKMCLACKRRKYCKTFGYNIF